MSEINIVVDKLTNSIENRITGDVFDTQVLAIVSQDFKTITKKTIGFLIGKKKRKPPMCLSWLCKATQLFRA